MLGQRICTYILLFALPPKWQQNRMRSTLERFLPKFYVWRVDDADELVWLGSMSFAKLSKHFLMEVCEMWWLAAHDDRVVWYPAMRDLSDSKMIIDHLFKSEIVECSHCLEYKNASRRFNLYPTRLDLYLWPHGTPVQLTSCGIQHISFMASSLTFFRT